MEKTNDSIRDRLLLHLPQPANRAAYREQVNSTLAKNDRKLRIERWTAMVYWLIAVGLFTYCVLHNQHWLDTPRGHISVFTTIMLLICGAVQLLRFAIDRTRIEILKEIKQVQLQMLELQAAVEKTGKAE